MKEPLWNAKSGIWMGRFFKIWPNLSQNWLKFKKILEKIGNFVQNLAQNWANWYMNGLLFLEKLVFVWIYFQIREGTKSKLEYPPNVGIGLYWITVGSVIYVIQAWKFSAFPRISDFCVCLRRCYFFTLKTRVFIAKRTKNRNVGPTKLRKTNIKIGKYYIAQDWNNNYRNPCPYLPSVPILAEHPDFRPSKT